ncbi:VWA domain-containing protein [Pseudoluteimonas lycopersici]|uniref:VWA domain-containing protein n=1 Tax=Pseudoluteimonas lycopersici TaxID=1324796 RepID=A0A516V547_9GAMM|nr:VWA domain-containing protein [Lysobacter lycopersici]QDQ73656.1 VWA domain-containing protein [Lysobacter lycopersici]
MSAFMPTLQFLRPWWLLALFVLPLIVWVWRARQRKRSGWRDVVDPHLLSHLLEGEGGRDARAPWLALAVLALSILALAGPSWRQRAQPLWQTRAPLVVALDLSSPILANDLPPSRLLQARAKIAELLKERAGGQVALVAYANEAYTVAPLTDDAANVALFLDALSPDVMPVDGSHAADAISRSVSLLKQAGFTEGDILLLSNAADNDAKSEAANAARAGYRVSVLGLGTAAGAAYRRPDGSIGHSALDAGSLQALASAGNGRYAAAEAGDDDLRSLGILDPQQAGAMAAQGKKSSIGIDGGFWLLPPLLLLALLLFRRGGAFAVVLACAFALPMLPAHAADGLPSGGTLWKRTDQQAYSRMQQGAEAYRKGDYVGAAKSYGGVPDAQGQYNYGNALAKQGDYEQAIAAYDRALKLDPGMADAIANRNAVEAALKRKPPQGDRQQQQQNKQPGQQGQPNPGQDEQGDPQKQNGKPQQQRQNPNKNQQQANGNQQQPAQQQKPENPQEQQRADEAQRQRMQQALQRKAKAGQPDSQPREHPETEAERERRIASEAWLRRVPDDPGGLLRAKFRLEYERRHGQGGD